MGLQGGTLLTIPSWWRRRNRKHPSALRILAECVRRASPAGRRPIGVGSRQIGRRAQSGLSGDRRAVRATANSCNSINAFLTLTDVTEW